LVHLVSFVQPNKLDKPDKPNNDLVMLEGFFSILLWRSIRLFRCHAISRERRGIDLLQ
jgi:hypothetical protein